MKAIRGVVLLVALTLWLGSTVDFTFSAAEVVRKTQSASEDTRFTARTAVVKPTIHALLVVMDGDPQNSQQYKASARWVNELLNRGKNLGIFDTEITTLNTDKRESNDPLYPTPTRILDWIREVKPRKHDVVFVYYCGHGANDDNGDYFDLVGDQLHEVEVVNSLKRSQAATCRLQILIADTCRVDTSIKNTKAVTGMSPATGYDAGRAYSHLFVEHEGFLHLASTSTGQPSWGDSNNGGWFTNGLIRSIYSHPDANGRFVGWNEIFAMAKKEVATFLKEYRNVVGTRHQQPEARSLPKRLTAENLAMWINAAATSQEGSDTDRVHNENNNTTSRQRGARAEIGKVEVKLEETEFKIHVPFKIYSLRNQEVDIITVFYQENGQPFENMDKRYGLTDGAVATWATVNSASEEAILSMPTRQLHLTQRGEYPFYIVVVIRLPEGNKELGRAEFGTWTYRR